MDVGTAVRYLDRHPWLSLATGVGIAVISIRRIRRQRQERRDLKMALKEEKRQRKLEKRHPPETLKARTD